MIPYFLARLATQACDRCSSPQMVCVVLALPWRTWSIIPSAVMMTVLLHHMLGLNT
ncbi:hypothetical protein M529_19860 [Sphingobium ummariense RL-3]|uniref:Uncharacterized protein n=1 Tax=Sphingobium ummariense RL-3 TaxID=1346791 RepID=T0K228_9SPHN|nr:hypothetical protein M529_19860 [Sphingobium ummariense RL-3]